jgi:hypothetical protein
MALYPISELAKDAGISSEKSGFSGISLAHDRYMKSINALLLLTPKNNLHLRFHTNFIQYI